MSPLASTVGSMAEPSAATTMLARHVRALLLHIGLPESQHYLGGFQVHPESHSVRVTWTVAPELSDEIDRTLWEIGDSGGHPLARLEDHSMDVMLGAIAELLYGLGCTVIRLPPGPDNRLAAIEVVAGPDGEPP
jgi:hypothetical protein